MQTFHCADCGLDKPVTSEGGTGYAEYDGKRICYACCGIRDEKQLQEDGKGVLYLSPREDGLNDHRSHKLTNWPETLTIYCGTPKRSHHNIARYRYDVWFKWKGANWHGVQYGDNTMICRVKRLKA